MKKFSVLCAAWLLSTALFCSSLFAQALDLTVLSTTDVHTYYMDYDYFIDEPLPNQGMVRAATIIKDIRSNTPNTLLVDNGDNIQGNPFGDYLVQNPPSLFKKSPFMQVLNSLSYDAMTLGNHEFNFGLDYLKKVLKGAKFPVVNANVVKIGTDKPYFTPYVIQNKTFIDSDGNKQKVKVGIMGLVPPQILIWDYKNLNGKVEVRDGFDTAAKYVPEMKAKGADIIIILSHSGINATPRKGGEENFSYYLTEIPGVDAIVTGHSHGRFPGDSYYDNLPNADPIKGTMNGMPMEMASSYSTYIGRIDLKFQKDGKTWKRIDGGASIIPVVDPETKTAAAEDAQTLNVLQKAHAGTLAYIRAPVGADKNGKNGAVLTSPLNSYYSMLHDDYTVQLINEAQLWYGKTYFADKPEGKLPLLSAAAPFKAGGRQGLTYYTNVPAGPLAGKNMADLYVFSNTLTAVKITGATLREWLERSAGQFEQVVPGQPVQIVNPDFRTYNYDVIDGVQYQIDVGQPNRYNRSNGNLENADAHRIINLSYNGTPVKDTDEFIVMTNNYRSSGGGNFPGINPSVQVYASPDENRTIILQYIAEKRTIDPAVDNNWKLVFPAGATGITYVSAPDAKNALIPGVTFDSYDADGFGIYNIDPDNLK